MQYVRNVKNVLKCLWNEMVYWRIIKFIMSGLFCGDLFLKEMMLSAILEHLKTRTWGHKMIHTWERIFDVIQEMYFLSIGWNWLRVKPVSSLWLKLLTRSIPCFCEVMLWPSSLLHFFLWKFTFLVAKPSLVCSPSNSSLVAKMFRE